jgi:Fusaric acid resistance protein-like
MASENWHRDLFRIDASQVSTLLFVRVAIAVGLPLLGFALAGHRTAAVAGGATAFFVSLSDIGRSRRGRAGTMALTTVFMLLGGAIGDRFGGTTLADEALIVASAFIAGWVCNSHPGIAAVARFTALATAAGVGMQIADPVAAGAVLLGGASAIGTAYAVWLMYDSPHDEKFMDWHAGARRALAGSDAGLWFAICYAVACAFSLFAAEQLGVNNPYWATFAVIVVMRPEGLVSLRLVIHYMVGTIAGVPAATLLAQMATDYELVHIALAAIVGAFGRLGFALNAALGYLAFTVFVILIVELARDSPVPPSALALTRLYDVSVGCIIALIGTLIAGFALSRREPH